MHPNLIFFGHSFPAYGVLGVTGIIGGLLLAIAVAMKNRKSPAYLDDLAYIYVFGLVGAMAGAKILYLITVLPEFLQDLPALFRVPDLFVQKYLTGGFVFYGGALGAVLAARWAAAAYGRTLPEFYPSLLPALALVSGVGRIGCFLAGCCYGAAAAPGCPIAVVFPAGSPAPAGVALLPVQLIEAGYDFLLLGLMLFLTASPGRCIFALPVYALLYTAMRFWIEFYRGDAVRGIWMGLSTSQWISAVLFAGALLWVLRLSGAHPARVRKGSE